MSNVLVALSIFVSDLLVPVVQHSNFTSKSSLNKCKLWLDLCKDNDFLSMLFPSCALWL